MTFTEAAVHVLRLVGKPLHYKEITDVAIEKDLLSHVGKSPEVTMGARLAAIVKKGDSENSLIRVKPGVFALGDWEQETIDKGLADRTPALKVLKRAKAEEPQESAPVPVEEESDSEVAEEATPLAVAAEMGEDERARAELSAAASDIFEAEDDDDEPILGKLNDEPEDSGERGRRRGRRRGRGRERDEDGMPGYTVSDVSDDVVAEVTSDTRPEGERKEGRERRGRRRGRDRSDSDVEERRVELPASGAFGIALADAVESALSGFRRSGSAPLDRLAEKLGSEGASIEAVAAAVRADNLRKERAGERPRFRWVDSDRLGLTEWNLDRELARLERDAAAAVEKLRAATASRLLKKMNDLPTRGALEFWLLVLERLGYSNFRSVKRASAHPSELHLAADLFSPAGAQPVAIVVRRDGRDVGRERVTDLRGMLHHYPGARLGLLVTTGGVLSGAKEEAACVGATPVQFLDGAALAGACISGGIGVASVSAELVSPDLGFFAALKAGG